MLKSIENYFGFSKTGKKNSIDRNFDLKIKCDTISVHKWLLSPQFHRVRESLDEHKRNISFFGCPAFRQLTASKKITLISYGNHIKPCEQLFFFVTYYDKSLSDKIALKNNGLEWIYQNTTRRIYEKWVCTAVKRNAIMCVGFRSNPSVIF